MDLSANATGDSVTKCTEWMDWVERAQATKDKLMLCKFCMTWGAVQTFLSEVGSDAGIIYPSIWHVDRMVVFGKVVEGILLYPCWHLWIQRMFIRWIIFHQNIGIWYYQPGTHIICLLQLSYLLSWRSCGINGCFVSSSKQNSRKWSRGFFFWTLLFFASL